MIWVSLLTMYLTATRDNSRLSRRWMEFPMTFDIEPGK